VKDLCSLVWPAQPNELHNFSHELCSDSLLEFDLLVQRLTIASLLNHFVYYGYIRVSGDYSVCTKV